MNNPYQLFSHLPLSLLRIMARMVAWLILLMPSLSINRSVHRNLQLAYPELNAQERRQLHRQTVLNQCLTSVESVKSWAMPPDWSIKQIHTIHNQDILTNALTNPNGMLAIVPHLGTWEMMNAWLNQFGSPTIMYKPIKGKISNDFVLQGRQRLNATLVPTDATGVKAIFKTLKSGGFSIILPDHVPDPSGGVVVPFFNIPTLSSTLTPKLANKTACALVGLACIRRDDNQGFDIFCYQLDDANLYHPDATIATSALNLTMQAMINEHKAHYMWGYRRFKYVPNINNIYQLSDDELQKIAKHYHSTQDISHESR
ncbi:KDO2-lipid IV(A) lauroyltransferase [Moraxella cuniculi DSM 21768]|uniref:KDO2-lipid IV(A) lauroyltransferase n=1 Tax=Moraxella cuniculi DSM 21768 TaxID=1122245 RepID=A0A1N7EXN8_9GAMM|nr:lysophospholipid acyltransferase family protein [Moraxella cuniculi]OOS02329.1 lipid A biosynthesis acyltransferase [Moraxella cuniculi]SIR92705.1 KDO2-lipid IV(A) lauroyltransferase [Moraxella cuniculi DSM 21768]